MTTTPTNMFGFGALLQIGKAKVSEVHRLAASTEVAEEQKPLEPVVTVDAISAPQGKGAPDLTC